MPAGIEWRLNRSQQRGGLFQIADGPNPTLTAMRATSTVPIVFLANDAIRSAPVESLVWPGRNVTGFSMPEEVDGKVLALLKELLPARIGLLETTGNPQFALSRRQFEDACLSLRLECAFLATLERDEIDSAITRLVGLRAQAPILKEDSFALAYHSGIIGTALKLGLPTLTQNAGFVREAGALALSARRAQKRALVKVGSWPNPGEMRTLLRCGEEVSSHGSLRLLSSQS